MPETQPLPLPPNFNPETRMLARREGDNIYHAPRLAAEFANVLLDNGTREDIDLAEKVLEAVLACQEVREADPHLGNFFWEREDEVIEDLNAVQFCLFQLIPLMIAHRDILSDDLQNRILQSIRLGLTDLGRNAPLRLVKRGTHLFLELYNYLGPSKTFWEQGHPGSFYQGKPQCGFYAELAERADYPDVQTFVQTVAGGTLKDEAAPPITYEACKTRPWTVEYTRDNQTLGIQIDLLEWQLQKRWTHKGPLGWPQLESPLARQNRTGRIAVGNAALTCGNQSAWLFACPQTERYIAAFHGADPEPLTLTVPKGKLSIEAMGMGTILWDNGDIAIEALRCEGEIKITGGRIVSLVSP